MKFTNNKLLVSLQKNAFKDDGEGKITFPRGLTITDDSEQRNGTKYDISSMDIGEYDGMLTADHGWDIDKIVGKTFGIRKSRNKVTIDGIQFAVKENPLAVYAYNMLKGGFLKDFSIETYGPWPDDDGVYHEAKLVGLSVVVTGNNKSASLNQMGQVALNSIKDAQNAGLDTTDFEKQILGIDKEKNNVDNDVDMKFKSIKNSQKFAVTLKYKNAAGEDVETTVQPGQSVDVSEDQASNVQAQVDGAEAPQETAEEKAAREAKEKEAQGESDNKLAEIFKNAVTPLVKKVEDLEQKVFDNSASEPVFKKINSAKAISELKDMNWREVHGKQINYAWDMLVSKDPEAAAKLREINKYNLEKLQEKDIVPNSVTIGDFGNFVISPELLTEIEGVRSDFSPLVSRLNFRETMSLQMAWLNRNGDVNMQEVEMCDDDADGNLKPISEYSASIKQSNLHELAAVTPVCDSATRFLAVDLLGDVAQGYRTDYDRKRAQLFIARLQQAVNETGNKVPYNLASSSALNPLFSMVDAASKIAESVTNGTWIFNTKSYWELVRRRMAAGANQNDAFPLFTTGENGPLFLGSPYIVVPNELMPSLNTAETKSFVVEGVTVTINQAMFYVDLSTFSGRTSVGLKYDLSTEAAYEVDGEVRSAFQRNELVLRGSFFRGGAVRDVNKVASLSAAGVS